MYRTLYHKIPKISPGAYIFQRPFLRGLFLEGLIYGGKFAFQTRLGKPYSWKEIYRFCLFVLRIWGQFSKYKPPGGLYLEGRFNGGFFLRYRFGGLISGGAYTWRGLFSEFYGTLSLVCYWPGTRIKLRPHADKLIQMMWTKDGLVTSKVFKVIHDDSHEKIKHLANEQW